MIIPVIITIIIYISLIVFNFAKLSFIELNESISFILECIIHILYFLIELDNFQFKFFQFSCAFLRISCSPNLITFLFFFIISDSL